MAGPRNHHYAPQFFLRNFATDDARQKIATVGKSGDRAIWQMRSISTIGYERDLYVTRRGDSIACYEEAINAGLETPISRSSTWEKISTNQNAAIDASDKPIIYALIRHLEARTPHFRQTLSELTHAARSHNSHIEFSPAERRMYRRMNIDQADTTLELMATSLQWTAAEYAASGLWIMRSPIPLRTSTTPVVAAPVPAHPNRRNSLPGMAPYMLQLTLNPTAVACIVPDAAGEFANIEIGLDVARGLNRAFMVQFARFEHVRHLVTDRAQLIEDMTWGPFDLVEDAGDRITFGRRS